MTPRARSSGRQVRDPVVGAAQLEAEDRLQVLALEQDLGAEAPRQPRRRVERRLPAHVVDAAREDEAQHLVAGRRRAGRYRVRHVHVECRDYMRLTQPSGRADRLYSAEPRFPCPSQRPPMATDDHPGHCVPAVHVGARSSSGRCGHRRRVASGRGRRCRSVPRRRPIHESERPPARTARVSYARCVVTGLTEATRSYVVTVPFQTGGGGGGAAAAAERRGRSPGHHAPRPSGHARRAW